MKLTAKIDRMVDREDSSIKAYASVNLDGMFVVKDIAVTEGKNGLFARMPCRSYKDKDGNTQYSDTIFGLTEDARKAMNDAVLYAYEQRQHMEEREKPEIEAPEEAAVSPTMSM